MKIIGTFSLAIAASFTLMQSAEARGAHYSGGAHFSAPARSYAGPRRYTGPSRNFSSAPGRNYSAPRISSMPYNRSSFTMRPRYTPTTTTALRNPTFSSNARRFGGDRTAAFNSRTSSRSTAQLSPGNRAATNRSQGFDRGRVLVRHSANNWHRNSDRGRDHFW